MRKRTRCPRCGGSGFHEGKMGEFTRCSHCKGRGWTSDNFYDTLVDNLY